MRKVPNPTIALPPRPPSPPLLRESEGSHRADEAQARIAESHRICPGCGLEMIDRGCKLRCRRCGFFLDCSDG
jgi:predicted RNA-binding Zn-ribbon protein involved in translation (DUF1610 family)